MGKHDDAPLPVDLFRSLDDANTVASGKNGSLRQPDEQSVLDDARYPGKPRRQRLRIGNPLKRPVENPVPAIRDESFAILVAPEHHRPGEPTAADAASIFTRVAASPNGSLRSAAETGRAWHPFHSSAMTIMRAMPPRRSSRAAARRRRL